MPTAPLAVLTTIIGRGTVARPPVSSPIGACTSRIDNVDYAALQTFLSGRPDAGDIIRGSGGTRKIRWGTKERGKRGGSRIIYYWLVAEDEIYLLTVFRKGVKDDLSPAERASRRKVVEEIKHG